MEKVSGRSSLRTEGAPNVMCSRRRHEKKHCFPMALTPAGIEISRTEVLENAPWPILLRLDAGLKTTCVRTEHCLKQSLPKFLTLEGMVIQRSLVEWKARSLMQ